MDRLIVLARNPVPSGAFVGTLAGHSGVELRYARWEATRGPRRGTVCVFAGRGEFIEKYFELIADLRRRGFAVATMDWRGQGGSQRLLANPLKGHVRDFAEYDADLLRFMKDVVLPDCPPPFIALGHSMGAHLLLRNSAATGSWFERMVLTAPMIRFHERQMPYPDWLARTYAEVCGALGCSEWYARGNSDRPRESQTFENNVLTSDRERWGRNRAITEVAPELAIAGVTVGWLRAALRSMQMVSSPLFPSRVLVPMLILSAGHDHIVSSRAAEIFANNLKVGTHIRIQSSRHEILQETDEIRQRFWAAFDAYLGVDVGVV